jgi:hypothetical protein
MKKSRKRMIQIGIVLMWLILFLFFLAALPLSGSPAEWQVSLMEFIYIGGSIGFLITLVILIIIGLRGQNNLEQE